MNINFYFARRVITVVLAIVIIFAAPLINHPLTFASYSDTYSWSTAPCASSGAALGQTSGAGYWCSGYNWGMSACPAGDGYCTAGNKLNGYYQYDQWGEGFRNCVSYTASILSSVFGVNPSNWGNGKDWNNSAIAAGYTDDASPQAGDIAQWDASGSNSYGHVAYVYAVNAGVASYAEYNYNTDGTFTDNFTSSSQGSPTHWIHIKNLPSQAGVLKQPSPIVDSTTGRNIFFVGADNNIHQWSVYGGHWHDVQLIDSVTNTAEPVNPGTNPSAVMDPSGTGRNVFYVGTDHQIWQWSVQGSGWHNNPISSNVRDGTSPSAIYDPNTGRNIFFIDADASLHQLSVQTVNGNQAWVNFPLANGGVALGGTSSSAVYDPNTGRNMFYVGLDSRISQFSVIGTGWSNVELTDPTSNQTVATGTSPSAMYDPSTGGTGRNIFYTGSDYRVWQYSVQSGWHNDKLIDTTITNQTVKPGTSPNAIYDSSTGRNIFYNGSDTQIWQYSVQPGGWHDFKLIGSGSYPNVDSDTSPGSVVDSSTGRNIFYYSNGLVYQWSVQSGWVNFQLQY